MISSIVSMLLRKRNRYRDMDDESLVQSYRAKPDVEIVGEFYVRYGHLVMGTSMKYLKNREDAEDLTMGVFENLGEKLSSHDIQRFRPWLYRVTKNGCLMKLRKKNGLSTELRQELESEDDLEIVVEKEEQLNLLEEAIASLKEEQRKCIELFYLERKSYQEITELMAIDLKKVKSAIQNGKRNLKLKLEGRNAFKSAV